MAQYGGLIGRIGQDRQDLTRIVERAGELLQKARDAGDDGYLDGVALNLHGFYTVVERILEDIARTVDGEIPQGSGWHERLLLQMSAEIPGVRPPVIQRDTRACLEEYRAFRHVVRNVYTFQLFPARLESLAEELRACMDSVFSDLDDFAVFLSGLASGKS